MNRQSSAPAEALPESLLTEARKLEPVVENLLNRIRDVLIENPPVRVEPADAQSPSQAIRTALTGMERVSAMLITVGQSLTDDVAEQRATLTVIDQLLTDTHDELERAEWAMEPSERQAVMAAPVESGAAEAPEGLLKRVSDFHESPQGFALAEADDALGSGIAMVSVALRSLEVDTGNEHEETVLRAAIERLQQAAGQLDIGSGIGARAFQPAAEEAPR